MLVDVNLSQNRSGFHLLPTNFYQIMLIRFYRPLFYVLIALLPMACASTASTQSSITEAPATSTTSFMSLKPIPKVEMRGVWISTVVNLDWPSRPGLPVEDQKRELRFLIDQMYENGFNAIFFQVRPEADALYRSDLEPWSFYLSGVQGVAPEPFYDPLQYAIELAHERGMELHAWLNPYRASRDTSSHTFHESHLIRRHPDWILHFTGGRATYALLNPGMSEVRDHIAEVVADIVRRYDVDGIHFDDYFYPYTPEITNEDAMHFSLDPRGFENIKDWRRDNINLMVRQVKETIHEIDPLVKFGISPFGIRLNSDAGTNGGEGYHLLYADPLAWLEQGTIDYIAPQIYWERTHPAAPYVPLMKFWSDVSREHDRHVYVGLAPYRLAAPNNWPLDELGEMLRLNRVNQPEVHGSIFFRAMNIVGNYKGLSDALRADWFTSHALIPVMDWKPVLVPEPVQISDVLRTESGAVTLQWDQSAQVRRNYVYRFPGDMSIDEIMSVGNHSFLIGVTGRSVFEDHLARRDQSYLYMIRSTGRNGTESHPSLIYVE